MASSRAVSSLDTPSSLSPWLGRRLALHTQRDDDDHEEGDLRGEQRLGNLLARRPRDLLEVLQAQSPKFGRPPQLVVILVQEALDLEPGR